MLNLQVTGLREIDNALSMLEVKVGKNYMTRSLTSAAKIVVKDARSRFRNSAVGKNTGNTPRIKTGNLVRSIGVVSRSKKYAAFRLVSPRRSGKNKGYHAHLIEYGHKKVLWGRKTRGRVRPFPFMRPAYDSTKDAVISEFISKFKSFIP
ncbi:MAG: hypothetical protein DRN81_04985 [Thermoproteota archaeon]|nr:MAG: hypothetical protein DRN81_04985 [Candidatus Korarchaeota archaeon]